ncbi:alpha-(1,6)-fucosyltransferase-like [Limulus polyphemus]|uniref:Alpha-(1,6)-fucosyltransferase-like n=1 Tax=Limulus polyphemus TaxID=6850 RepID=A0ABM1T883_LIMPO|nr:alpha-(1,6)-fucosyltransferase-like [Limulus polyphemus]
MRKSIDGTTLLQSEVSDACEKMNKEIGPNGIKFEIIQALGKFYIQNQIEVINQRYENGEIPEDLSRSIVIALPKKPFIEELQNPQKCKLKQALICNLTNLFGFASGIHDVLWCFVKAYHTNRTLVLISKQWHYAPDQWNSVFLPLSPTCDELKKTKKKSNFPGNNEEYMLHVDDFYRRLGLVKNVNVRRVFVATDDPKVLIECKKKYPNYVFVFNSDEKTRYSNSSLVGVVTDVFLLAHSNFLGCTLSSGVRVCSV